MARIFGVMVVVVGLSALGTGSAQADEKDAVPILDKAIEALGGEAKLTKATAVSWKSKGTININGNEAPIKLNTTLQGIDHQRGEFELEFNGEPFKGLVVVNGPKAWRKFGDDVQSLDDEAVASAKQGAYLVATSLTVLPLKSKGFKAETAADEKVNGKPADVIKATGPDGKTFTIAFDKETHLPVKMVATVKGMQGEEFVQETIYSDYKAFDGLKRATKIETKRDGNVWTTQEASDFLVIDKPDASLFDEPK